MYVCMIQYLPKSSSLVIDRTSSWSCSNAVEVPGIGHGQLLCGQLRTRDTGLVPPEACVDHEDVALLTGDA